MEILAISPEYPPSGSGIAVVAKSVIEELKKRGHSITVCSPQGPDKIIGRFWNHRIKVGGFSLILFWFLVFVSLKREKRKFDLYWFHDPLFIFRPKIRRNGVFTIHTTYQGYKNLSKTFKFPIHLQIYYRLMFHVEKLSFKRIKGYGVFTGVNKGVITELRSEGIYNTFLIRNGVNTNVFVPKNKRKIRKKIKLPENRTILLYLGRLSWQKNLLNLLKTYKFIQQMSNNMYLLLVGEGEMRKRIEKMIRVLNLKDIDLVGHIPHDRTNLYYTASDFYLMASLYEGMPLSVLEAISCGCIPILSDIPCLRDIIDDLNIGLILDFNQPRESASRIINYLQYLDMDNVRRALISKISEYDWSIITENYLKLFFLVMDRIN